MNRFLRGTLILFISGIILKVMGFFYQVFIVRTIGTEAIGLVNMVHPYYIAPVIIATMGMPDRKSTRLNSSHVRRSRMPSSA